jgi:nucleoside-diphosphate-sugar epimerase
MMKVLLIGGTGIISTDITLLASQKNNIELYLLNRGSLPQFVPANVKSIQADIYDVEDVREKIKGMTFDVVADFISYDIDSLNRKLELFRSQCGQYIFISSCIAYRQPHNFEIHTEENTAIGNPLWSYGWNKALCEKRLVEEYAQSGMPYTIVRPSYTYNNIRILHPYTINHWQSWTVANRLLKGKPYVLHDDGQQLCTATHACDFAKGFIGLWGNPAAMNEAFHITSTEYLTWKRIAELTADALGVTPKFCFVPAEKLYEELGSDAGIKFMHTSHHEIYDNTKIRKAVPEFVCSTTFAEGTKRTIQFYLDHPEYQKINDEWEKNFDRIVEKYQ